MAHLKKKRMTKYLTVEAIYILVRAQESFQFQNAVKHLKTTSVIGAGIPLIRNCMHTYMVYQ